MRLLPVLLLLLAAPLARAHPADLLYLEVHRSGEGLLEERLTLSPATLALLVPVGAPEALTPEVLATRADALRVGVWEQAPLGGPEGGCVREAEGAALLPGAVQLSARFRCGAGPLRQRFQLLDVLPAGYRVVLGSPGSDERQLAFAAQGQQTLLLEAPPAAPGRTLGAWVLLGVQHILVGADHLAFLLALLLVGATARRTLLLVTAFTLAHSLTLSAAALGWVPLGARHVQWVEALIALSVVYVALENLLLRPAGAGHRHRAVLTFLFGLVHGLGFAGALAGVGLGERGVAWGLLGFNLGVEVGQAAVVLVLFPMLRLLSQRPALARWGPPVLSCGLVGVGTVWLVERVAG